MKFTWLDKDKWDRSRSITAVMQGKTFTEVRQEASDVLLFISDDLVVEFWHDQNCCESVAIEDITGDLKDLEGVPLLMATEESNEDETDWGTGTWTFYKFRTQKGDVTVRWRGESNGYYSESVDCAVYTRKAVES